MLAPLCEQRIGEESKECRSRSAHHQMSSGEMTSPLQYWRLLASLPLLPLATTRKTTSPHPRYFFRVATLHVNVSSIYHRNNTVMSRSCTGRTRAQLHSCVPQAFVSSSCTNHSVAIYAPQDPHASSIQRGCVTHDFNADSYHLADIVGTVSSVRIQCMTDRMHSFAVTASSLITATPCARRRSVKVHPG